MRVSVNDLPVRVRRKISIDSVTGCWKWTGYIKSNGYGTVGIGTREQGKDHAHRFVYSRLVASIPEGLEIDHLCRNRSCVNPTHMRLVSHAENMRVARNWNREKTHCKHGHEFTEDNTGITAQGFRFCKACRRARSAKYRKDPRVREYQRRYQREWRRRQRAAGVAS